MACTIQAWLDNGEPRLQVLDCHSGHLRMAWKPSKHQHELNNADVKSLFRALLDVSVIEQLANQKEPNNEQRHRIEASYPSL